MSCLPGALELLLDGLESLRGARSIAQLVVLGEHGADAFQLQLIGVPLHVWVLVGDLGEAARLHSDDMATREYFSHSSPEGFRMTDRMESAGYSWWYAGETIAVIAKVDSGDWPD